MADETENIEIPSPKIIVEPDRQYVDPVKEQKKKDSPQKKKRTSSAKRRDSPPASSRTPPGPGIPEKESLVSAIVPPLEKRNVGIHCTDSIPVVIPRQKVLIPGWKKQQKMFEKNRANTAETFYKYEVINIPEITTKKKVEIDLAVPSPEASSAKVVPRKSTPSPSFIYPPPPDPKDLELRKPKSGVFIHDKSEKEDNRDYDSFDLVYSRKPRPSPKDERRRKKRRKRSQGLEDIQEADEDFGEKPKKRRKGKKRKAGKAEPSHEGEGPHDPADIVEEFLNNEEEMALMEQEEGLMETYLTKQLRRKVSQISKCTSYQSKDYRSITSAEIMETPEPLLDKYSQKFRRDSEVKRIEPVRRKIKRGTLESHSLTNIHQPTLKDFFFGSKEGSMHQGDENFPESIRNCQGICMPVAAYCYAVLKHPNKWTTENIDEILEAGNELTITSRKKAHLHHGKKELKPQHLQKYCAIGDRKVQFVIEDPEVFGFIRSDDPRVYNLSKGLKIFFHRQSAGILTTQDMNIAIWKHKYFYMFDAKPRTRDLYYSPYGTAMMANFYDIPALTTVFLTRSNFGNWPFVIYPIKTYKVLHKDDNEEEEIHAKYDGKNTFQIMNENKAVLHASFDLGDKCFDFTRNKQSLAMATVCLVYSRITPPSAWQKTTMDKIMIIGNQLCRECMECETINHLTVDCLPALFTIGPYIVEIYIYANVYADLLFKKCCCSLLASLEKYFEKSTNGILQIGNCHMAVWKQRNMYYLFDPYSRDDEGYLCRDGTACVTMHTNVESLVHTVANNYNDKNAIFYFHAFKVCKIQRDPAQLGNFPMHMTMDNFPLETFKTYKMKKSRKVATEKPITVDYSSLAMRKMLADETPQASIFEIGSTVESLGMEQIPPMVQKHLSKTILMTARKFKGDIIADLDSPSLSDTQIEPCLPQQSQFPEEVEFMDLDSFALTQEEIEMEEVAVGGEEGFGTRKYKDFLAGGDNEGLDEDEGQDLYDEDWFTIQNQFTQIGEGSLMKDRSRISEEVNTDLSYFPIKKEVLYPTYVRDRQQMKKRLALHKSLKDEGWDEFIPREPEVTQSEELRKETNFKDLPDGTQIVAGTKNVAAFGADVEYIAPFICVMANVVARKYTIGTWTGDIIDYVLKCGTELYKASKLRYDQVSKLEIPKITLGNSHFAVLVEYVFDTYTKRNILELAIEKILFIRSDMGVMVTPTYACALMQKNHLYYLYDAFGNNEVGLSEGPKNTGVACFSRFKDVHSLVTRVLYNKSKRESNEEVIYARFVLSSVRVKTLHPSQEEVKKKKKKKTKDETKKEVEAEMNEQSEGGGEDEPKGPSKKDDDEEESDEEIVKMEDGRKRIKKQKAENKVGYQNNDGLFTIEGNKQLSGRGTVSNQLKEDHFVCICACLMLLTTPVNKWDTKKVNQILQNGSHVFSHAEDLEISEKRTIQNVLIDKHFFDIIVKQQKIENWRDRKCLSIAIDTILGRKIAYFLVQFPNACYVIHKSQDGFFHMFDPYGFPSSKKKTKAGWVRFKNENKMKRALKKVVQEGAENFIFYNFEVTSIRKAPKDVLISNRLETYDLLMAHRKERLGKPFYEDVEWLKIDPVPWSRKCNKSASGQDRGKGDNMWHNWDIEYKKDLYSLTGNIHQTSGGFPEDNRGKQTLANLVVAIGMMEIYNLAEWNSSVIDSVLVNGDNYFTECVQDITEENYELSIDDMKENCTIFPFSFKVEFKPVVEGTMFLVRLTQFNLYKALRYFFNQVSRRCGIICCSSGTRKRQVAFGKLHDSEYFMFDCECMGPPMFLENKAVAYIMRTTTLNRLLHILTLTLRGGDFFVFHVEVSDVNPIS